MLCAHALPGTIRCTCNNNNNNKKLNPSRYNNMDWRPNYTDTSVRSIRKRRKNPRVKSLFNRNALNILTKSHGYIYILAKPNCKRHRTDLDGEIISKLFGFEMKSVNVKE